MKETHKIPSEDTVVPPVLCTPVPFSVSTKDAKLKLISHDVTNNITQSATIEYVTSQSSAMMSLKSVMTSNTSVVTSESCVITSLSSVKVVTEHQPPLVERFSHSQLPLVVEEEDEEDISQLIFQLQ